MTEIQSKLCRISYLDGYINGVTDFAYCINGIEVVGYSQKPLNEVLLKIREEHFNLQKEINLL